MKVKLLKTAKIIGICLVVSGILVTVILPTIVENKQNEEMYANAEQLILSETYADALAKLEAIEEKNIKDTASLIKLCNAHIDYNNGNISSAHYKLEGVQFSYQTDEQLTKINGFKEMVNKEYDEYVVEQSKIEAQREAECRASYANTIPYEGMSEKYIDATAMGKHHEYESVVVGKGKRYEHIQHEYRWNTNSGRTLLYVECEDGKVTYIIKYYEDSHWTSDGKPIFSGKNSSYSSTKKSSTPKKNDDPYNAKDYYDAEDFYDDYYDEFYDYEEAEEYYNEHGMWN